MGRPANSTKTEIDDDLKGTGALVEQEIKDDAEDVVKDAPALALKAVTDPGQAGTILAAAASAELAKDGSKLLADVKPRLFAVTEIVYHDFIHRGEAYLVELEHNVQNNAAALTDTLKAKIKASTGETVIGLVYHEITKLVKL